MTDRPFLHLSLPVDDLHAARAFYEHTLGCRIGREREDWFDVWFYGLQLTLHLRPLEVMTVSQQGVRHFGVILPSLTEFDEVVDRVAESGHPWISKPEMHSDAELNGKLGGKLADPSGNIIEIKFYADSADFLS